MNTKLFPTSIDKNPLVYSVFVNQSSVSGEAPPPTVTPIVSETSIQIISEDGRRLIKE